MSGGCHDRRRVSLAAAACGIWLLSCPSAPAVLDANGNGMSDVWEKQFNGGVLFTWDFLPWADADGDGVSNGDEAIHGTDPFSTVAPAGLLRLGLSHRAATFSEPDENGAVAVLTPEILDISFPTSSGKQYTLESWATLAPGSWLPVGGAFPGTGSAVAFHFPDAGTERMFFRTKVADVDADGDGLTDLEESRRGGPRW